MSALRFRASEAGNFDALDAVAALATDNPLQTEAYLRARERLGEQAWVFALERDGVLEQACHGFVGASGRHLEIPSVPDVPTEGPFWEGLHDWLETQSIASCELASFGSERVRLPAWPGLSRRQRTEWVLDLDGERGKVSSNHRRNARRAEAAGAELRMGAQDALDAHLECMESSLERRDERGESVRVRVEGTLQRALVASGCAQIAQAVVADRVVSSILVLRSATGAYYQSAGTLPEGRKLGASQFLVSAVADRLGTEGVRSFNLGGAQDDNPGLQRFKRGFGARAVPLEAASFSTASPALSKLKALGRRARDLLATGG